MDMASGKTRRGVIAWRNPRPPRPASSSASPILVPSPRLPGREPGGASRGRRLAGRGRTGPACAPSGAVGAAWPAGDRASRRWSTSSSRAPIARSGGSCSPVRVAPPAGASVHTVRLMAVARPEGAGDQPPLPPGRLLSHHTGVSFRPESCVQVVC